MDFRITQEQKLILETVRDFVRTELMPLEAELQKAEIAGRGHMYPDEAKETELQHKAKELGLWGINTPEEYGGINLGVAMTAMINMEVGHCFVPFRFGGSADNILYSANDEQKAKYLLPTIGGERKSCFAITEPTAGSDATNLRMTANRDASGDWILNGEKIFITGGNEADFAIVFAVSDKEKGHRGGITAFLVDRAMGWTSQYVPTMGSWGPARLLFDNVRVPAENVLGEIGWGFRLAMQWILTRGHGTDCVRRLGDTRGRQLDDMAHASANGSVNHVAFKLGEPRNQRRDEKDAVGALKRRAQPRLLGNDGFKIQVHSCSLRRRLVARRP